MRGEARRLGEHQDGSARSLVASAWDARPRGQTPREFDRAFGALHGIADRTVETYRKEYGLGTCDGGDRHARAAAKAQSDAYLAALRRSGLTPLPEVAQGGPLVRMSPPPSLERGASC